MPRIRQNIVTGEWVVVAPERAHRPDSFAKRLFGSQLLHHMDCVFCHGGEAWQNRIKEAETTHIYTIPNKFPAFTEIVNLEETGHNFYTDDSSVGAHEVVIMKDPADTLENMTRGRLADLLVFLRDRAKHYEHDSTLLSMTPIYNHGHESGASVAHPHAQFFASALVPPRLRQEFFGAEQYFERMHTCVFCAMAKHELQQNVRVIARNSGAVVFATYAPRFPFETWIIPTTHHHAFSSAHSSSLTSVADCLHQVIKKLSKRLNSPPLNWFVHTARKIDVDQQSSYHWHIEVTPRVSTYGGYELGTDMTIETVLPEVAADYLQG